MNPFESLFASKSPLIGVVHLMPLPGSPRWGDDWNAVETAARRDASVLVESGADGLIVENFGDAPFFKTTVEPITVASMSVLTRAVRAEIGGKVPIGVNVLRNNV
ncbi:MAG: BtpA/SgcQ family protein, partial [Candidatus Poribacteria bacterium]|nr:BtpA/SgcQ family protein [Candidatus Poribacteria bacterium]